jgi:hypothetical protein
MITYKYPKSFWLIAEEMAEARTTTNKSNRKNNPRFDRGDKNKDVDILGVVGELIVLDYLTEKNIDFEMIKLLNPFPIKEADFTVKGKRIDVKTSRTSRYSSILVNEEAHKKGLNKIDLYWFVYILDDSTAEFYFADYPEVNDWDCKLMKYTNAYYIKKEQLK